MSDLYQIVDENDQLVGHKKRNEIDFNNEYYRFSTLWLTNSKGEVLIAQRKLTKDKDPGKWGPAVAGTVEQGEDYESNIYKEAEEELGLKDIQFTPSEKIRFEKPRKAFCQVYIGTCDWDIANFTPQPSEVEKVDWVLANELVKDVDEHPDKYVPSMTKIIEAVS